MERIETKLGKRIRELRRLSGLTQEKLAELTDLSSNFIGSIERGLRSPKIKTLEKIACALKVKIADLFKVKSSELKDKEEILKKIIAHLKKRDYKELNQISEIIELFFQ